MPFEEDGCAPFSNGDALRSRIHFSAHCLFQVSGGWYLKIAEKQFVKDAIPPELIGKVTPRRFFEYDYSPEKIPMPIQ